MEPKDFWENQINKAISLIKQEKLDMANNFKTANAIFPLWEEFILQGANLDETSKNEFENLGCGPESGDKKIIFIQNKLPQFQFQAFWAITMLKLLQKTK